MSTVATSDYFIWGVEQHKLPEIQLPLIFE